MYCVIDIGSNTIAGMFPSEAIIVASQYLQKR